MISNYPQLTSLMPLLHAFVIPTDGMYFVQSLELSYGAQGNSPSEAIENFLLGIKATAKVQTAEQSLPQGLLKRSPGKAWQEFATLSCFSDGIYPVVRLLDASVPSFPAVLFLVKEPEGNVVTSNTPLGNYTPGTRLLHAYVTPDGDAFFIQSLEIDHFGQGNSVEDAVTGFLESLMLTAKEHLSMFEHEVGVRGAVEKMLVSAERKIWGEFDAILYEPNTRTWLRPVPHPATILFPMALIIERVIE